jgi:pimeloyl-ACP methyl ester carboxylesterase
LLIAEGHTVIMPDLPGHGRNTTPIKKITLNLYSIYISQLLDNIENNVVLIGHSMGGMVISQVAEQRPEKISQMVYLSAYLPKNGQSVFDLMAINRDGLEGPQTEIEKAMELSADKRTCMIHADKIIDLFFEKSTPSTQQLALQDFSRQATLPLAARVSLSQENFGSVNKTYISCLNDCVIPVSQQRQMFSQQSCDVLVELDSDHSPFYSCPEKLAEMFNRLTI